MNLKPNPDNPRTITKEAFERLKGKIKKNPDGLTAQRIVHKDGIIIAGNQRWRALQELKLKLKDDWFKDVTGWTDEQIKDWLIDSNISDGEWDWDLLANQYEPEYLIEHGIELPYKVEQEVEEDEAPPIADVAISKLGEIYQLGRHRLMCGDSLKDIDALMGENKARVIFTDPPYNVDYGSSKKPRHKIRSIENDKQSDGDWAKFNSHLAQTMSARCTGDVYIFGASSPDGMRARLAYVDEGFHWSATIIWKKQQLVFSPAKYQRMYEPCFYGWFDKSSFNGSRTETEVWEIDRPLNSKEHPTMKPIELCAKGIRNSSKKDDIVLDLFGGSGSTLIACEQLGRTCYMMELDEKYCDVIRKRYWKFTHDNNEEGWEAGTKVSEESAKNG